MQMNLLYGMLKYLYQNPDSFITESIMRFSLTFNSHNSHCSNCTLQWEVQTEKLSQAKMLMFR